MPMTDIEYTKAIENIWRKYQSLNIDLAKLQPLCYTELPKFGLLIIGLNPSINPKVDTTPFLDKFYPEESSNKIMQSKKDGIGYHKALKSFAVEVQGFLENKNFEWGHIDLFFFRKRDSKFVKKQRKIKKHEAFYNDQIELTRKMTISQRPKVIVVNNAYASYLIFKYWMEEDESLFNRDIGTYRFNGIPIFFSSMLSSGVLDRGSRKRLAWQVASHL